MGALLASRLLARFSPKKLVIAAGALGVPALLLLPYAPTLGLVIGATGLVWFSGGFVGALLNVFIGLSFAPEARGKAFGLLFLASPLAAVLGVACWAPSSAGSVTRPPSFCWPFSGPLFR